MSGPGIMWSTAPRESPWFVDFDGITSHNHVLRIICEHAEHLEKRLAGRGARVEALAIEVQVPASFNSPRKPTRSAAVISQA